MSYLCFVINDDGQPLMPIINPKNVRKLLKNKRAKVYKKDPFTIRLLFHSNSAIQPIEICIDAGYKYIGFSIKSEKHEYWSAEYTLLSGEKEALESRRKYRRTRRGRLRYRRCKFPSKSQNKRLTKQQTGWISPSLKNKADRHVDLVKKYSEVCPIASVTIEIGQFDTSAISDYIEEGKSLKGIDYQQGFTYGYASLREAVFYRDDYECQVCHKGIKDGAILRIHHIGYRVGDRSNRPGNLLTVCTDCHTHKNHQKGGKLWDIKPSKSLKEPAYMNGVKNYICSEIKKLGIPVYKTYGAHTKMIRHQFHLPKSHANDAYCIGSFYPSHRAHTKYFEKRRRNFRILSRFIDAQYKDVRNGVIRSGSELSCGRTNRSIPRNNPNNLRIYRGQKTRSGRVNIRQRRYPANPGDIYRCGRMVFKVVGTDAGIHKNKNGQRVYKPSGRRLVYRDSVNGKQRKILESKCTLVKGARGWIPKDKKQYIK